LIAWTQFIEQLGHDIAIAQFGESQAAFGNTVILGKSDQWLRVSSQFLGFRQGGLYQFMIEQRASHAAEQCLAMAAGDAEFSTGFSVSHYFVT